MQEIQGFQSDRVVVAAEVCKRWRFIAAISGSADGVMLPLKRQLEHCGNPFRDKVPPRGINISDARCCDAAFTHAVAG